ncbi:MAG TPA: hypothetical protein DIW15_01840 [Bavariicoccus seileri]|uniref:S1 motif domain-containing protein n=1 Tax=Bavariicoccus seileri TaxID=549685 RepID=A0A3D4S3M7_9ENTE|nr:CvfD/Ygs/GSP13 family RNA-binding post-transcriptional regulator [Bavariicoccus seileri]HCS93434.1 hypothetical protein [Bavariicoccus seileri]
MTYKIGMVVEGIITGVQPYGVFVSLGDGIQGLIHISECDHGFIKDLSDYFKLNEKVKVKVIDVDEYSGKISLSVRALKAIDTPEKPKRLKKKHRYHKNGDGFLALEKAMPKWINVALKDF